jgi:predicted transcriptional regulator
MGATVKDRILESLEQLPATATVEDAMERLYFLAKVERGLADLSAGRQVDHSELVARYGGS